MSENVSENVPENVAEKAPESLNKTSPDTLPATLVLLFKRPLPGQGKQRLAASLGQARALLLAESFLSCALEDLAAWQGPVVLAPASIADVDWATELLTRARVVPQTGGNLGQRIIALDQQLRGLGHQQLLYIGSDAPALTTEHYCSAASQAEAGVVLSAADDGGVTLMGSAHPWPAELIDLPWSTDQLGNDLAACCHRSGLSVSYIAPSYDLDIERDLARLSADLADDDRPARQVLYQLLQTLRLTGACCTSSST
ncbi:MAG: glycosyltransferase A (GT-A) superfamily protein (DUF2064 family) [Motiliproteus sp.]